MCKLRVVLLVCDDLSKLLWPATDFLHTHTHTHTRTHTHTHTHTHTNTHTHKHTHTYTHARTHAHTYTHIYTRAHDAQCRYATWRPTTTRHGGIWTRFVRACVCVCTRVSAILVPADCNRNSPFNCYWLSP